MATATGQDQSSPQGFWAGVLALLLCAALWSLNGPLIKLASAEEAAGVTIAFYRSLLGGVFFLPMAIRHRSTYRSVTGRWLALSIAAFTLMTVCFVVANTLTAAANAIILQYTAPMWVFLLSPLLLDERPDRREALALTIAMVGIVVIVGGHDRAEWPALTLALASGLGFGALTVILRKLRPVAPSAVVTMNLLGSAFLTTGLVAWLGHFTLTLSQFGLVLMLGLVQFALPYLIYSWALQRVEAHRASLIVLLECVLNPMWTFLLVGEVPPAATLIGGPLILLGVAIWILMTWRRTRRAAAIAAAAKME